MKKRYSIGWLIGVLLALTSGTIVLVLVPIRTCPLCLSMGDRPGRIYSQVSLGMPLKVILNCPTCKDKGKVTVIRGWRSPTLAPQVRALLEVQDKDFGSGLDGVLDSIIVAGGKDPQDILGKRHFAMTSPLGEVRFLPDDERGRLLLLFRCGPLQTNSVMLVLLEADGFVLDVLSATSVRPKPGELWADALAWHPPRGVVALVSLHAGVSELPPPVWWYDERGKIPESCIPEPNRVGLWMLQFRIGVEGDRLRIIPSAAPPAGP